MGHHQRQRSVTQYLPSHPSHCEGGLSPSCQLTILFKEILAKNDRNFSGKTCAKARERGTKGPHKTNFYVPWEPSGSQGKKSGKLEGETPGKKIDNRVSFNTKTLHCLGHLYPPFREPEKWSATGNTSLPLYITTYPVTLYSTLISVLPGQFCRGDRGVKRKECSGVNPPPQLRTTYWSNLESRQGWPSFGLCTNPPPRYLGLPTGHFIPQKSPIGGILIGGGNFFPNLEGHLDSGGELFRATGSGEAQLFGGCQGWPGLYGNERGRDPLPRKGGTPPAS